MKILLQLRKLKITFIHKDEILYFSSKQSFEEKYILKHMMMRFLALKPYFKILMCLLTIIGDSEELINETLDLLTLKC